MRTKLFFFSVVFFILITYLNLATDKAFGQQVICQNGQCWQVPNYNTLPVTVIPQQIYVPRVYYQPHQYQGSVIQQNHYPTPVRRWFFGGSRSYHYYSPVQRGQ